MGDRLVDVIGRVQVGKYLVRKGFALYKDLEMYDRLYISHEVKTDYDETTILAANVNGNHGTREHIEDLVNSLHPMFIWLIDTRKSWHAPSNYHTIEERNFHQNTLWIRNDILRGRIISRTQYGIQVDNIAFRYITPNAPKENIHWKEVEVGDFNFLSNKWINLTNLTVENRKGKPGGLGCATKKKIKVKFYKTKSDHDIMWLKIKGRIKSQKMIDKAKLDKALSDAVIGGINKDIYKLDNRWDNDDRIKIIKESNKLIDPVKNNLDLNPFRTLYKENPSKNVPEFYYPKIRETNWKKIHSKALDINGFPIRNMILKLRNCNLIEKQRIIQCFGWIKFSSRTVCLLKKGKEPDKVTNLRPIQISPWNFKIAEQSRQKLKMWIENNTSSKCYAFKKKAKIEDIVNWIKGKIYEN